MSFVLDDIIDRFWKDGRVKEMEEYAERHAFDFTGRERFELQTYQIRDFQLFRGKRPKRLKGILTKTEGPAAVRVYDYIYYGEGEKRKSTVYEIFDEQLNLPRFIIRPKRSIQWVKEVFGGNKWFYPECKGFHSYYEIEGPYHDDLAFDLTQDFVDLVSSATRIRVEGEGSYLIVYKKGKQTPVRDILPRLDFALDLWESLGRELVEDDLV